VQRAPFGASGRLEALDSLAAYDEAGAGFQVGAVLGALLLLGGEGEDGFVEDGRVEFSVEVVDSALEGADLVGEVEDDVGERVVDLAGVGDEDAFSLLINDVGGDADDGGVRGTSRRTTEPAPTREFSPMVMLPRMLAVLPTKTLSRRVGWRLPLILPVPPRVTPW